VLDSLVTGFEANVNPQARFYQVDITDESRVAAVFKAFKPEIVIHHAAQMDVRVSTHDPIHDARVNILGTLNILLNCVDVGTSKMIYASTGGAVHGEALYLPVREDHPINPISQYGISKHTVEHYLFLYRHNYGLQYTILRYPNVYGPRQNPHGEAGVVAIFIGRLLKSQSCVIYGDGNQTRDYVYVSDIVESNLLALDRGDGEILNVGSGVGTSVNEIYAYLKAILGTKLEPVYAPRRVGEIEHISLDPTYAGKVLGWTCRTGLREGLTKMADYFRALYDRGE